MTSLKQTSLTNIALWDDKAEDWHRQVGEEGNRRFNSNPVLWRFLGPVRGSSVLDAGCGTGYLSRRLSAEGGRVLGVDFAPRMIDVAKRLTAEARLEVEYRVDSCATLATVPDASFDKLVSNYVLQDLPELDDTARAFHRVLRPGGLAVVVFSHPCFPQSDETDLQPDGSVCYRWPFSYFEEYEIEDKLWPHFRSPIVYYQRPLGMYWRAFRGTSFDVVDFDEPVIPAVAPPGYDLARLHRARMRPLSVVFALRKVVSPSAR